MTKFDLLLQDPFAYLEDEHKKVSALFEKLADTTERAEVTREEEFNRLNTMLSLHAEVEEKILYPALEDFKITHEITLEAFEEHHVIKLLLKELAAMSKGSEEWKAKLTVLQENVDHHVKEEENDMFKKARKALDEEQTMVLGEEMATYLQKHE